MAGEIPTVTLNSGHKMPVIGLGTVAANIPANAASIFFDAIQVGYRHFDTAALYGTEVPLGQAVAEAIRTGLMGSRHELFITSKLWCDDAHHDLVVPALNKSLTNLGLEFVDLYLVRWPVRILKKSGGEVRGVFPKEDVLPFDMKGTWEAMEECQRLGLAKSIGVSNFSTKKLQQLLEHATVPPSVNQVEMNTSWNQKKLRDFCEEKGIHITAWSPLGANGASWGTASVMENPVLKEIASRKGKTVAQVALRWLYEQGVSMVVKSFNRERMRQNLDIFGWELNQEELDMMAKFPQHRAFDGNKFVSPDGPYKSIEELWDGEI